jgi:hypothetical protein
MSDVEVTITVFDGNRVRIEDEMRNDKLGQANLDPLRRATIAIFEDWLRNDRISRREELQVLGQHLYETLFNGEIERFFEERLQSVVKGDRLRVQLYFAETAKELATLPWEYLWYPRGESWFSTAVDFVLSRFLPPGQGGRIAGLDPGESPLRILVMVSEPEGLNPVIADPVYDAIDKLKERFPILVNRHDGPTRQDFVNILKETEPHVVHFLGHGRFRRDTDPPWAEITLPLSNKAGEEPWCRDQDFAECFRQAQVKPRLVFLHLCEGAVVDFRANFAGLAPQLIRRGMVPAVVGMQYPIANKFAIQFSRAFYEEIAKGEHLDAAVQTARYKLTHNPEAYDTRVFGTPVLYMYSHTGIIRPAGSTGKNVHSGAAVPGDMRTATRASGVPEPTQLNRRPGSVTTSPGIASDKSAATEPPGVTRPTSIVEARVGTVDPQLRAAVKHARREAQQRLTGMALPEDEAKANLRRINSILDEITADASRCDEIIETHWNSTEGELRELVELIEDSIQQWKKSRPPQEPGP